MAVLAWCAALACHRAVASTTAVLARPVHHLCQPAHAPRLLRRARILREPPAAVRVAAPWSFHGRAGVSRRDIAQRLAAAVARSLAASVCAQRAAASGFRLPAQSVDRVPGVRRRDAVLAVAVRAVLRHAGLAPVSGDELEHGPGRAAVLVADPGQPPQTARATVARNAHTRRNAGDGAA